MFKPLPPRFRFFYKSLRNEAFNYLDVGAGSGSPSKTAMFFSKINYYGIDRESYRNSEEDMRLMKEYYQMDLTELKFDKIPDNNFNVLMMSHVIEHLHNGDKVIEGLISKLKKGGKIYIEYPGKRSTRLPSMRDTLNFYDDETHVRIYSIDEIETLLEQHGFKILKSGTRRYLPYILALPITLITETIKKGYLPGGVFWDLLGFAEYVYAEKL